MVLPDYNARGQIFQLTENGVTNQHPFDWLYGRAIVELMPTSGSTSHVISPQKKAWFDKWPITWTLLSPGAFLPILVSIFIALFIRNFLFRNDLMCGLRIMDSLRLLSLRCAALLDDRAPDIYCLTAVQANALVSPHSKRRWPSSRGLCR